MVGLNRVKTGIPGFDALVDGGIPERNLVILSGDPGSGKTVMSMQFLYYGAKEFNEPGIFILLEESREEIIKIASIFGWNFEELIEKKLLELISVELYDFDQLKNVIEDSISKFKAKRIVIDPGVIFRLYFIHELEARKQILGLGKLLKKSGCTAIITNESMSSETALFGLEEYVADGVILLFHKKEKEKFIRSIAILKMRGTRISEKMHPVSISKKGIEVHSSLTMH
jgi:circadian clock protein KaiC